MGNMRRLISCSSAVNDRERENGIGEDDDDDDDGIVGRFVVGWPSVFRPLYTPITNAAAFLARAIDRREKERRTHCRETRELPTKEEERRDEERGERGKEIWRDP